MQHFKSLFSPSGKKKIREITVLISCLFTFISGVSERELQDKDTRDFIYDFIDRHGGIEAALEEVENRNRTPAPAPPPRQSSIARPPPPSKVCTVQGVSYGYGGF